MAQKKQQDYAAMKAELDTILTALQQGDSGVADAIKQYERGLELITALEQYLDDAQNTVAKLQAKASERS